MATLTKTVARRLGDGLKRFQPILSSARARDVNESDTSMIIADMLADVFGFDKYAEITRELCIRNTYCDLAIRIDDKVQFIIEVKAIDTTLKDTHVKQAVDYAANEGVEWVALTNGVEWHVYRVIFGKPIDKELVVHFDLLQMNQRSQPDLERLFLLTKESMQKSALDEYHGFQQATNKFLLGALVLSEPVLSVIRREIRRTSPGLRIETAEIKEMLAQDVLKREVLEGDKFSEAKKTVKKTADRKLLKVKKEAESSSEDTQVTTDASQGLPQWADQRER